MKIALVSNMNNNYFALLRYLVDFGLEARLFLFEDEHEHFHPECDTWNFSRWSKYIEKVPLSYSRAYDTLNNLDNDYLNRLFQSYDRIVVSGPVPAYFSRTNIKIDIFFPYKTGIEYWSDDLPLRNWALRKKIRTFNLLQRDALRKVKQVCSVDFRPLTRKRLNSLGQPILPLNLPFVYEENISIDLIDKPLRDIVIELQRESSFNLVHVGRHLWKQSFRNKLLRKPFINDNANDSVVRAFSGLVAKTTTPVRLVLTEYGPQVEHTKELVRNLGIEEYVYWLPLMKRKELSVVLDHCHVGIGDIAVGLWGGKAIEYLAKGLPCINSYTENLKEQYCQYTKSDFPPFLKYEGEKELESLLVKFVNDNSFLESESIKARKWYEQNDGEILAKKLLEVITAE